MTFSVGQWQWTFDQPATGLALVILLAATIWAIRAAWRRLRARHRARSLLVAALNAGAALALALMLAPPDRPAPAGHMVELWTPGAPDSPGPATQRYAAPGAPSPEGVIRLSDVGQLRLRNPEIDQVRVIGHGLTEDQWLALPPDLEVSFTPPPLEGLTEPAWPRRRHLGQPLVVTGRYRAPDPDSVARVMLIDPSGLAVDQASVRAGAAFELTAMPRARGLYTWRLQLERAGERLADEPLPVEITGGDAVTIGVLQSAPSFETRQLQHWAGRYGARLQVLTRISRDRHIRQAANADADAFALSPGWLDQLDLLVMDGRYWTGLPAERRQWVGHAVQAGLGLLLLSEPGQAFDGVLDGFALVETTPPVTEAIPVPPGFESEVVLPIVGRQLVAGDATPLTVDENGVLLEAWRSLGMGRVAVSILRERHRWFTTGRLDLYTAYWAELLRTVARPSPSSGIVPPPEDLLVRRGLRHRICARALAEDAAAGALSWAPVTAGTTPHQTRLPMATHELAGSVGCMETWPWVTGWHRVEQWGEASAPLANGYEYVFPEDEWRSAGFAARQAATLARVARNPVATDAGMVSSRPATALSPTGPWWLFVICALGLWVERKQDQLG